MSTTISSNATEDEFSPDVVDGYQATRESQNIVHDLISGGIAVTLIQPRPRSGTLRLIFGVEADAWGCYTMHSAETTFELSRDGLDRINMTYVLAPGNLDIELDATRKAWIVSVPFQEVTP